MMESQSKWVSVKEAAEMLGRDERTVRRWHAANERGEATGIRTKQFVPGGAIHVLRADVIEAMSGDARTCP